MSNQSNLFKVVKIDRKSNRRQILRRNLTEAEAQRVVKSYPDSNNLVNTPLSTKKRGF